MRSSSPSAHLRESERMTQFNAQFLDSLDDPDLVDDEVEELLSELEKEIDQAIADIQEELDSVGLHGLL